MATQGEQELEDYESDPEEVKRSLGMRRREAASDDEEEGERGENSGTDRRPPIHSDESDGQGGAADYDDEQDGELEEEMDEEGEEEEEEEIYDDEEDEEEIDDEERKKQGEGRDGLRVDGDKEVMASSREAAESDGRRNVEQVVEEREAVEEEEEEKKENEPYAVPTAGAFYMHDDRFKAKGNLRHSRRTQGGRRLWESKDDRKWGHDKFEEMNMQERNYDEGRRASRGRYRARGKNRGPERGYPRGNRSKGFNRNDSQNPAPKGVRGRGPRRYDPSMKNSSQAPASQNKQSGKPLENTSHTNSGRAFAPAKNSEAHPVPTPKQVFASSLSSASPPFYPSGSSNKDITLTQKKDVQSGSAGRNLRPSVTDESYPVSQPNALLRGKNIVDSIGMDKLYIDDSGTSSGKPMTNLQMSSSGPSIANSTQGTHPRAQGRGVAIAGQMAHQPVAPHNQANRLSPQTQLQPAQRNSVQSRVQSSVQAPSQQLGQRSGTGSQASSPPKTATSTNSYEPGEVESSSESSKSKGALVGKGKGTVQGNGRGSFPYGGAQVMGSTANMAAGHGDQNFPAFLPVMQFGGQHPGGIGVPAVGMAFPGYVAQPQLGLGNSEMTWLPVLTGAAGAYCSPYIAMDGAYHARPSGQTASMGSLSKENNTNKPNNEWKASQRPEPVSDEFGQRQNKQPRRYSEMNFGQ